MIQVRNNYSGSKSITIDVDANVSISLKNERYDQLITALELSMAEKVKESDNDVEKSKIRRQKCRDFIVEIREFFYDMDVDGFGLKRGLKELNIDELDELLNRNASLLGFE